jgi:pilus assembly protein CpaF
MLGPLASLVAEPDVTDVLVNGCDRVWVERAGRLERVAPAFASEAELRSFAVRLTNLAGGRLDDACPFADSVLPGGLRMHAVLHPVSPGGTAVSLRVPRATSLSLAGLVALGAMPGEALDWLDAILTARLSFLISGAAGSGKTTVLAAALGRIGPAERLVLIEETSELRPIHPHVVRLATRAPNVEGAGGIGLRDLIRQALRMRPDRLVVGEARGAEVLDLLAAFNTGHDGGAATVHANTAAEVPARLEALAATAGMDRAALHSQLGAAISVVLHLRRDRCGVRRLAEIAVPGRRKDGIVCVAPALLHCDGALEPGPLLAELCRSLAARDVPTPKLRRRLVGVTG